MILEAIYKYGFNIDTFHRFNFFLGTTSGELLKRSIELIFYLIILYMIFSEFNKNKKREYKYLIIGFLALFLRQAMMCIILFSQTFSVDKFTRFYIIIPFIDNHSETLALLLLVAAFIFPIFYEKTIPFQRRIVYTIYVISFVTIFTYLLFKFGLISTQYAVVIQKIMQIAVLIAPFFLFKKSQFERIRYKGSVLAAFFIYMLIPLITITSFLLFGYLDPRMRVLMHPLPFISILLLMRAVYLTLVDKAWLQNELRESKEMIKKEKELSKLKDQLISIVSHELKTPVTSVKLYLSLLKKGQFGRISSKQGKAIGTIVDENNRLSYLIDDLLVLNKIKSGKLTLNKSRFKIKVIIDKMYITLAREKGIKIVNRINESLEVYGDKIRLKQVYVNLMNNAIKFSEKGSTITLNAGTNNTGTNSKLSNNTSNNAENESQWFFSIKDSGIGIPKEEIPKMFEKFYQVENVYTRKNQGIGLGLSIVKNIVSLHNGRITVKSQLKKGTEIIVKLPLK